MAPPVPLLNPKHPDLGILSRRPSSVSNLRRVLLSTLNGLSSVLQCRLYPATTPPNLAFSHIVSPNPSFWLFPRDVQSRSVNRCWIDEASARLFGRSNPLGRDRPRRARLKFDCMQEISRSGRFRISQIWNYVVGIERSTMDWSGKGSQCAINDTAAVNQILMVRSVGMIVLNAGMVMTLLSVGPRLRHEGLLGSAESAVRFGVRPGLLGNQKHRSRRWMVSGLPFWGWKPMLVGWPRINTGWVSKSKRASGDCDQVWAIMFASSFIGFRIWDPGGITQQQTMSRCDSGDIIESFGVVLKDDSCYYAGLKCANEWTLKQLPPWVLPQNLVLSIDGSGWVFDGHSACG